ncbi:MAG: gliding motility-associated C-terminal domain-containing protein [Bacteroidetes bacterium]|nr:gliding motility-associated C-terminal domain-containing protein [Bacteroidota bacterium]
MRKTSIYLIIAFIFTNSILSNPLPSPFVKISELKFEENNKWFLEIEIFDSDNPSDFDSICIETSNGFSRIRSVNYTYNNNLLVITSDSLLSPLSMNSEGDYVKVYPFPYGSSFPWFIDSLYFGDYPGSIIDSLQLEYSIARINWDLHCKDRNPTIGLPNDTIGTCGSLRGHIYNKYNELITEGTFMLDDIFYFHDDGTYSTNVYSRKATFRKLYFVSSSLPAYLDIDTIELNVNPGVLYEKDVHILDDFSEVEEDVNKPNYKINIINYPNPFNSRTNFAVTIPSPQKYRQKQINIYNTLGQKINSISLTNQSSVQWDGKDNSGKDAATGTYFYQLILDNKVCKSGSMILLK